MANITITNLPVTTSLNGTEAIPAVQSGTTVQISTGQIVSLANGSSGNLPFSVSIGGTGDTTLTQNGLLLGNGISPITAISPVASGSVLISNGTSSAPSFSSSPTLSGTITAAGYIANKAITGSLSQGAFAYGSLNYSDTNIYASLNTNVNSYSQIIIGNQSSGASASTDVIVGNDQTTASAYFGDFGMNSSGFSGTGSLSLANAVFLSSTSSDLAIGTTTSNAIHFVVNNGATDAATISSAGVLSLSTALPATSGGTGQASYAIGDILYASTTTALSRLADVATGNALISGGVSTAPSWGKIGLATHVSGTLPVGNGGTGQSSNWTQWGAIYASTTGVLASTATGTTGQPLIANSTSGPAFGTLALGTANTNVSGTLTVTNGGTGAGTFTANGIIYGNTTSALGVTAAGTTGQILIGNTSAAPSWSNATSVAVTSISFGTTGLTPNTATQGAVTVAGTLATANGGTNLTTFTAANNAIYSTSASVLTAGTLPVAAGGTGATTLTLNGVLYGNGTSAVQITAQGAANTILTANAGAPSFSATPTIGTSVTVPLVIGGTAAGSTLTLQSTSGAGTTDSVVLKTGNNGAVTAATFNTAGVATSVNWYNTATQTATNTATLTAAQITSPFLLGTPTATASYTLPLASAVETALGTPPNETGWEFIVFTTAAFAITLLTNTGWTLVGSMATGATANSFARFRARKTGAGAYSLYRIS